MFKTYKTILILLSLTLVIILFSLMKFLRLTKSTKDFQPTTVSTDWIVTPNLNNEQVGDSEIVKTESLTWNDDQYQIIHLCQGEVKQAVENGRPNLFSESPKYRYYEAISNN